jgi:hypothetical protein
VGLRAVGAGNGVVLRAVGAGNGEGARCGICGDARCGGWACTSRGEKGGG